MAGFRNELEDYRWDTPGASTRVHLNNAGASLAPEPVLRTVIDYIRRESQIGGYEAAEEAQDRIARTYQNLAWLVGANAHEIGFVDSATRAWNTILYGLPLRPGDRILTSMAEFGSNALSLAHVAGRTGATVEVIPNGADETVSLAELEKRLDDTVKLVAITHVPAQRGVVNPVAEIGRLLKDHHTFYLVDACQSVGQIMIDVTQIGCDALTTTGRKWLRGPRGTAFFYLKEDWIPRIEPLTVDLDVANLAAPEQMLRDTRLEIREDIKRFEMWERSLANMLGLGKAAEYALRVGINHIQKTVGDMASYVRHELTSIKHISVEDAPEAACGIITITSEKMDVTELKEALSQRGINTSIIHDDDGPLDFVSRDLRSVLRISPHYYNSTNDLEMLLEAVRALGE